MDPSLFLTEIDVHHPEPLVGNALRAYIVQHSLFFDKLLVGDSQFNNNSMFRQLIWEKENNPQNAIYRQDLWELSEKGFLVPVVRNEYGSLSALRKDHVTRGVKDLPTEDYSAFIDEKVGNKVETYNIKTVATAFRERVLEELDDQKNIGRGKISKKTSLLIKDYVLRQDPLLFNSFREWMQVQVRNGAITQFDYNFVDELTGGAYRCNVAVALEKTLDTPNFRTRKIYPVEIEIGDVKKIPKRKILRKIEIESSVVLSQDILSKIPASALIEIKKNNLRYAKITRSLEVFRTTGEIDFETFAGDLQGYLASLELMANDFLTSKQKSAFLEKKKKEQKKAWIKFLVDAGTSAVSLANPVAFIAMLLGAYGVINAFIGGTSSVWEANKQPDFVDGYILGRSNSMKRLYEIKK